MDGVFPECALAAGVGVGQVNKKSICRKGAQGPVCAQHQSEPCSYNICLTATAHILTFILQERVY